MNDHLTAILFASNPGDIPQHFQPVHQFDRAVMFQLQTLRQLANGRLYAVRQALNRQEQLVLLRLHSSRPNLLFAEAEESANLIAELSQRAILFDG